MSWINSRLVFPKRRAQLLLLDDDVNARLLALARDGHLGDIEDLCTRLCTLSADGRYAGATLHALTFDAPRWCWTLTVSHPALNAVAPGMQSPDIPLGLAPHVLAALAPRQLAPADLQGQGGTVDRLDQADEPAQEVPPLAPGMATEERQFGHIAAREPDPDDVE